MPSTWIERRNGKSGVRFRVEFRVGGRESASRYAGSFRTMREAKIRRDWIAGELAALRVPDVRLLDESHGPTLRTVAENWKDSRRDVAEGTRTTYTVNLNRILPRLGDHRLDELHVADVDELVAELHAGGCKRESIRKTLSTFAQVLDYAKVEPNPARDPSIKLPREAKVEPKPPTAEHVEAVVRLLPVAYRLPALVLDATGMRVGELEALTWGDVDEPHSRFRVSAAVSKSGRARWVNTPAVVFLAVSGLVAREDRTDTRPVFQGFGADRFRTAIARACRGAGVPTFSPHDLRHRRVSLMHEQGVSWARIGEAVGHGDIVTTARTYTHVLGDSAELDYEEVLR
ncbi:MAG: site-specific integrase [Actinobacteria bacterium]|nr:site-specific integrase [Actinomycetota bacterium]